jgi:hypothetical protein
VTVSTVEGGSGRVQGRLWGARARDWAEVQEATSLRHNLFRYIIAAHGGSR